MAARLRQSWSVIVHRRLALRHPGIAEFDVIILEENVLFTVGSIPAENATLYVDTRPVTRTV